MARRGNGSTAISCMSCDPTHGSCYDKCQNKVNYLYYACDGICLPDGYFFDPRKSSFFLLSSYSLLLFSLIMIYYSKIFIWMLEKCFT